MRVVRAVFQTQAGTVPDVQDRVRLVLALQEAGVLDLTWGVGPEDFEVEYGGSPRVQRILEAFAASAGLVMHLESWMTTPHRHRRLALVAPCEQPEPIVPPEPVAADTPITLRRVTAEMPVSARM